MLGKFIRYGDEEDLLHCGLDIDTITFLLGDYSDNEENPHLTDEEEEELLKGLEEHNERLSKMTEQEIFDMYPYLKNFYN
jgi:hypothetical protein